MLSTRSVLERSLFCLNTLVTPSPLSSHHTSQMAACLLFHRRKGTSSSSCERTSSVRMPSPSCGRTCWSSLALHSSLFLLSCLRIPCWTEGVVCVATWILCSFSTPILRNLSYLLPILEASAGSF